MLFERLTAAAILLGLGLATKTHLIISLPFCTLPVAPRTAARTHRPL